MAEFRNVRRMGLTLLLLLVSTLFMMSNGKKRDPREGTKMSFKAPQLDEEAQWSNHVPSRLTCEGCKAISYKINEMLWKFHQSKYPQDKMKPESDVIIAMEEICTSDTFNSYGVKNVNGATKLSGPGLKADESAGMIMGGGRWPARLAQRCGELMGEFDEYDIYSMTAKSKGREAKLFKLLCTTERDRKLNSCGGGLEAMLEPGNWQDGKGKSYTVEEEDDDDDDDYDDDYDSDDGEL